MCENIKPEISRICSYEGGDVVQIFGEGFTEQNRIFWWRPESSVGEPDWLLTEAECSVAMPEFPPQDAKEFKPDKVFERVLYFGDAETVPGGTAVLWVEKDGVYSRPVVANRPRVWNLSAYDLHPGGNLSVYGKDFGRAERVKTAVLRSCESGRIIRLISAQTPSYPYDAYKYSADFRVPSEVPDGKYELLLHSGKGGAVGWSEPVAVVRQRSV